MERNRRIVIAIIRIVQFTCGATVFGFSIGTIANGYDATNTINSAWAGVLMAIIAALSFSFFLRRPLEVWPLALILDCSGIACGIAGMIEAVQGWREDFYNYESAGLTIASLALIITATALFLATGVYYLWLHDRRTKQITLSNSLTPYLMKKEIDVWCYPVQNENGQPGVQYVPASTGVQGQTEPQDKSQNQAVGAPQHPQPPIAGEYQIDRIEITQNPQQSIRSQPLTDTVAGWTIPSGNATLRLSQVTPFTLVPSYRSREPTIDSRNYDNA